MFSIGTKYTVTSTCYFWKPVICSNCKCEYYYRIYVEVSGQKFNLLWLDKSGAVEGARGQAQDKLILELYGKKNSYRCPNCHKYSQRIIGEREKDIYVVYLFSLVSLYIIGMLEIWFISYSTILLSILFTILLTVGIAVILFFVKNRKNSVLNSEKQVKKFIPSLSKNYQVLKREEMERYLETHPQSDIPVVVLPWKDPDLS